MISGVKGSLELAWQEREDLKSTNKELQEKVFKHGEGELWPEKKDFKWTRIIPEERILEFITSLKMNTKTVSR